jgi:mevalonate kinase
MVFKSNGKFLLTGEYLVLKGATALALPLKKGQSLDVEILDSNEGIIHWDAFYKSTAQVQSSEFRVLSSNYHWFSAVLDKNDFSIRNTDDKEKAERLSDILSKTKSLNGNIFTEPQDYKFTTLLDFDPQWGLGSSSTLINNVAEWAEINPYKLLDSTFKGSGYDIACAKSNHPIFFKLMKNDPNAISQNIETANFDPIFKDNLYFVYHGHKQSSANEIKAFLSKDKNYESEIKSISEISRVLPEIETLSDFCYFIKIHEEITASCLEQKRLKKYFNDFEGEIKSLGAWGGDFFLVATEWDEEKVKKYFDSKDLDIVFKYNDIVL